MKLTDHIYWYPESGMIDCNTYLVKDDVTIVVDAGFGQSLPALIQAMEKDGIDPGQVDLIVNTHLHLDHTWANTDFKRDSGGKIALAPVQKKFYGVSVRDAARFFGIEPVDFEEDDLLDASIDLGNVALELIETPGHSPCSLCFYCAADKALISGDLVFDHSTGRSDLPGGDGKTLRQSIEAVAERDTELLLPGHMGVVEGKSRVKENFDFVMESIFPLL